MTPVLDVDGVKAFLADRWRSEAALDDLGISYVKLRIDGPVLALLEAPEPGGGTVAITARFAGRSDGARLERIVNERVGATLGACSTSPLARPAVHAPSLGLLLVAFPFDRRLQALPAALDRANLAERLAALPSIAGREPWAGDIAVRPINYKPEGKCVFAVELGSAGGDRPERGVLYGKVAKPSIFGRSRRLHGVVSEIGARTHFAVPEAVAVCDDLALELWSELPGVPFADLVGTPGHDGLGFALGRALRGLHDLAARPTIERPRSHTIHLVADNAAQIARYVPREAERAQSLGATLDRRLRAVPCVRGQITHHDFHAENVLVDDDSLGLIDFEDLAIGDGAFDVGSIYGHLTELALCAPQRRAAVRSERARVLTAYDVGRLGERFVVNAAAHCLLRGYQSLRYPGPGSVELLTAMLDESERLLDGGGP